MTQAQVKEFIKSEIEYIIENYEIENIDKLSKQDIACLTEEIEERFTYEIDRMIEKRIEDKILEKLY